MDRRGPDRRPAAGWRQKPRGPRREAASPLSGDAEPILIYGLHAVSEALANPRREITRLLVTENALRRLEDKARSRLQPEMVGPHDIARLLPPDAVHQGIMAEALPLIAPELDDLAEDGMVLALDQITDPHNVGAILRTASAFAVKAVIVPMRHSPAATGVLAKAASGALEHVPIVPVRNLADALIALAERGFLRVGLDSEGEGTLEEAALRAPLVLALGAEGKGLRDRVRQSCDLVVRIDLPGAIKSLNVSNAAAIALSVIHRRIANSE
ncbi:23S rRNA (guanosine2251-2'-O)-methyltransferase [Rhizobiales bacterium GAS113]|nr:23S rRNA (guanosine2251-2'-O)-methyltransferase [Rhizobiales bacterium GAS113]SEC74412.1 23S rRNA (guanosine2251-2'-O)-methyltransferase [Rhizobiales bacterium GAS188]